MSHALQFNRLWPAWWIASAVLVLALAASSGVADGTRQRTRHPHPASGFSEGEHGLTPAQRAGREIWFKATAGNESLSHLRLPAASRRADRLVSACSGRRDAASDSGRGASSTTPTAARPASPAARRRASTRRTDSTTARATTTCWRTSARPGIAIPRATSRMRRSPPHGATDQRQSACDLEFGTSTGALGFRKFPNPRFDADRWRAINGSPGSWSRLQRARSRTRDPTRGSAACSTDRSNRRS